MAVNARDVILLAIGFMLVTILTPIGMNYIATTNGSFNVTGTVGPWSTPYTMFTVLLPVLYIIGAAVYFIPKIND
jgi:hypothetical protein